MALRWIFGRCWISIFSVMSLILIYVIINFVSLAKKSCCNLDQLQNIYSDLYQEHASNFGSTPAYNGVYVKMYVQSVLPLSIMNERCQNFLKSRENVAQTAKAYLHDFLDICESCCAIMYDD